MSEFQSLGKINVKSDNKHLLSLFLSLARSKNYKFDFDSKLLEEYMCFSIDFKNKKIRLDDPMEEIILNLKYPSHFHRMVSLFSSSY